MCLYCSRFFAHQQGHFVAESKTNMANNTTKNLIWLLRGHQILTDLTNNLEQRLRSMFVMYYAVQTSSFFCVASLIRDEGGPLKIFYVVELLVIILLKMILMTAYCISLSDKVSTGKISIRFSCLEFFSISPVITKGNFRFQGI